MCKDREGWKREGRIPCVQQENVFPSPGELNLQGEGGSVAQGCVGLPAWDLCIMKLVNQCKSNWKSTDYVIQVLSAALLNLF